MTEKLSQSSKSLPPPNLLVSQTYALEKIQTQIDKGNKLKYRKINDSKSLGAAYNEWANWKSYNTEMLLRFFDNTSMADNYSNITPIDFIKNIEFNDSLGNAAFNLYLYNFFTKLNEHINHLEEIRDRLDLIPETKDVKSSATPRQISENTLGRDVFLVHGHDASTKESVSRFVEKLGFKIIVLHEQPNAGRTIIEKFEEYSSVGFAIILLTPDDIGAMRDKSLDMKPRARQNVILEFGYFIAKLGRERVCALHKEEVELPSDIQGLLYIPFDTAGAWRLLLAKEMKHVGFTLDMNKVI